MTFKEFCDKNYIREEAQFGFPYEGEREYYIYYYWSSDGGGSFCTEEGIKNTIEDSMTKGYNDAYTIGAIYDFKNQKVIEYETKIEVTLLIE